VRAAATPSDRHTYCAYKGRASYLSFAGGDNLAWYYPDPLPDAVGIQGLVAFYNERVEITVDGEREGHLDTDIAKSLIDEFGLLPR
jgi:uncharacterized protein (DUF427 family)